MSDLSLIPIQDGFETQLSQEWNGATGTVYVLATPSYTPTTTNTYIVVNPGKTNMQIAEITDYDSTAKTLTVSSISFYKGLGISSTQQTHTTGSKVIISDNYQFWADIKTAINSKLDDTGGTMTGLLEFSGTTHGGIKVNSLTTVQRDALTPANGLIIYNTTTGEFQIYQGGAWSTIASGSTQPNASTTVLGKIKTDVAPASDPVALITDNPKYDALAGTSGTPSTSNKYVTNDDTSATSANDKVYRLKANGKIDATMLEGNLPALDGSALTNIITSKYLAVQTTDVSLSSSSTETDIIANTSVPANSLLAGRAIEVEMFVALTEVNTSGDILFRLYFGGSSVASIAHNTASSSTQYGIVKFRIAYTGTSSQYITSDIGTSATTTTGTNGVRYFNSSSTSAIDTTVAQNIKITVQGSAVNTPTTIVVRGAIIKLI